MDRLSRLYRRLLHRHDNLGIRGLLGIRRMPPLPQRTPSPHPFDLVHGAETGGFEPGEALATGSPADLYNTAYYAISTSSLAEALARIPCPLESYTFVDLGCGKGRALLVAADFPFARLLGVEISPWLSEVALRNTAADARIQILNQDAARVTYPPGPMVVFLYHPFLKPVLSAALRNLQRQLWAQPRPAWLLYANPSYQKLLARSGFLEQVWDFRLPLSAEDAAADRHGIVDERYTLYRAVLSPPA